MCCGPWCLPPKMHIESPGLTRNNQRPAVSFSMGRFEATFMNDCSPTDRVIFLSRDTTRTGWRQLPCSTAPHSEPIFLFSLSIYNPGVQPGISVSIPGCRKILSVRYNRSGYWRFADQRPCRTPGLLMRLYVESIPWRHLPF